MSDGSTLQSGGPSPAFSTPASEKVAAFRRLLRARGIDLSLERVARDLAGDLSLEALARQACKQGVPAQRVRIEDRELAELELPALLELRSGAAVVVTRVRRRTVELLGDHAAREWTDRRALLRKLSGGALDLSRPLEPNGRFSRRLLRLFTEERARLYRPLLASLYLVGLGAVPPLLFRQLMDRALPDRDVSLLWAIVLFTGAIAFQTTWMRWLRGRALCAAEAAFERAVTRGLYSHFVRVPLLDAQRRGVGTFVEGLQAGVTITRTVSTLLVSPLLGLASALCYLVLLWVALPPAGALALGFGVLTIVLALSFAPRLASLERQQIAASAVQVSNLHEMLTGIETLKACGAETVGTAAWLKRFIDARVLAIRQSRLQQWQELCIGVCRKVPLLAVFAAGAQACLDGELSVGAFVATAMFAEAYADAVAGLAGLVVPIFSTRARLPAVDALLELPAKSPYDAHPRPRTAWAEATDSDAPAGAAVSMENVWFRYSPDEPWILKDYHLSVRRGEQRTLRGASGVGKTTVLRILAGVLQPERGRVLVYGRPPAEQSIAYLPQDGALFGGSIGSNLRILSGASHERIVAAARATGLAEWLERLPMGLETVLPPGGGSLSGGQRQLVLITAAVASEKPVLLLDESLANLDRLTQHDLRRRELFEGKTVISVAHE